MGIFRGRKVLVDLHVCLQRNLSKDRVMMRSQETLEASLIKSLKTMWLLGNNSIALFTLKCYM